jgi:hypothetical protein
MRRSRHAKILGIALILAAAAVGRGEAPDPAARAEDAARRAESAAMRSEDAARRVEAAAERLERLVERLDRAGGGRRPRGDADGE